MVLEIATRYLDAGWSVLPIRPDGSKAPTVRWNDYRSRRASSEELRSWFSSSEERGVGLVCGKVSGGVVVFDFDAEGVFDRWREIVEEAAPGVLERCSVVRTPKGYGRHVYVRRDDPERGRKLARRKNGEGDVETLIEIRGEGNYVLAPGCPGACHPSGATYERLSGPDLSDLPSMDEIDGEDYEVFVGAALSINEHVDAGQIVAPKKRKNAAAGTRPGDDFSAKADWREILEPYGWKILRNAGAKLYWQRPGKKEGDKEHSATTGFCESSDGDDLLFVFSTKAPPFEPERAYAKFSAFALLEYAGDWSAAARCLAKKGYGSKPEPPKIGELTSSFEAGFRKIAPLFEAAKSVSDPASLSSFPKEKLEVARKNFPTFDRTWRRTRADFETLDLDELNARYLSSLVCFGVRLKLSPEEISRLVFDFFAANAVDYLDRLDPEDLAERAFWFHSHFNAPDTDGIVEFETEKLREAAEDSGDERGTFIEDLRRKLGLPVVRWVQSEIDEATYTLVLDEDEKIRIGGPAAVQSSAKFELAIYVARGELLPGSTKTAIEWRKVLRILGIIREVKHPTIRRRDQTLEWIDEYVHRRERYSEDSEEGWQGAVPGNHPFVRGGEVWIHVGSFRKWLTHTYGEHLRVGEVRDLLRDAGLDPKRVDAWFENRTHSKMYWHVPIDELPHAARDASKPQAEGKADESS